MKYTSEMKPVDQTSFEIGVCVPEDIVSVSALAGCMDWQVWFSYNEMRKGD